VAEAQPERSMRKRKVMGRGTKAPPANTSSSADDRRAAYQLLRVLSVSNSFVLGRKGLYRSGRRGAVRVDQLPVESTVTLPDDLEVGTYGQMIILDQRSGPPIAPTWDYPPKRVAPSRLGAIRRSWPRQHRRAIPIVRARSPTRARSRRPPPSRVRRTSSGAAPRSRRPP
jgi:hypothetical protein